MAKMVKSSGGHEAFIGGGPTAGWRKQNEFYNEFNMQILWQERQVHQGTGSKATLNHMMYIGMHMDDAMATEVVTDAPRSSVQVL